MTNFDNTFFCILQYFFYSIFRQEICCGIKSLTDQTDNNWYNNIYLKVFIWYPKIIFNIKLLQKKILCILEYTNIVCLKHFAYACQLIQHERFEVSQFFKCHFVILYTPKTIIECRLGLKSSLILKKCQCYHRKFLRTGLRCKKKKTVKPRKYFKIIF